MAGNNLQVTDPTDYSSFYRDDAVPVDATPEDSLFNQIVGANAGPHGGRNVFDRPASGPLPAGGDAKFGGHLGAPTGATSAATQPHSGTSSTAQASGASQGLIDRLKPMGITSLDQLKGKSDVELRKLSADTVQYELRKQNLAKFFRINPDGSWDFTTGPDGNPTGLDATGKPIAQAAATASPQAGPTAGGPAPKPAPKPAPAPGGRTTPPQPKPKPTVKPAVSPHKTSGSRTGSMTKVTRPPVKSGTTALGRPTPPKPSTDGIRVINRPGVAF